MDNNGGSLTRRSLLVTSPVLAASVSGCNDFALWGMTDGLDFEVRNEDDHTYRVTLEARGPGISEKVERTTTVLGGESAVFEDVIPKQDYDFDFQVNIYLDRDLVLEGRYTWDTETSVHPFKIKNGDAEPEFEPDPEWS